MQAQLEAIISETESAASKPLLKTGSVETIELTYPLIVPNID